MSESSPPPNYYIPASVNITSLPPEVLSKVMQWALPSADAESGNSGETYYSQTNWLAKCMTTHSSFYNAGVPLLYRHVAFSHSLEFDRFLKSILETGYGVLVKCLDFSDFTSVGLGRTARMNQEIQYVTAETICHALELCPNLAEFLGSESIGMDMSAKVLTRLLSMPYLEALDFCGATHPTFTQGFIEAMNFYAQQEVYFPNLIRLSFHACSNLSDDIFQKLLPRLPNLEQLDLTHTQVKSASLLDIPASAKIKYLSLARCYHLDSQGLLKFLVVHPATRQLEWLSLMFEATKPSPIAARDFDIILKYLPMETLTTLNLHGCLPVNQTHLELICSLKNLESLSLGYTNIPFECLRKLLPELPHLKYIDISGNPCINQWSIQDTALLNANRNVEMFEISSDVLSRLTGVRIPGFCVLQGQGNRGWVTRGDDPPTPRRLAATGESPLSSYLHTVPQVTNNSETHATSQTVAPPKFSFSQFAQAKIEQSSKSPPARRSPGMRPIVSTSTASSFRKVKTPMMVLNMDMGSSIWIKASRKINMCQVGIGGLSTSDAVKERGIYLYYAFNK
ncbi:hypothetical protein B0I72DRAFT_38890 [Yarrowia lipolytica]|jgi:hypothetical protein|uniref:YALI0C06556p n=2 Tax=Yarrowia lipolytica TaxID=4952 RepID=Q6CCU0_YARLI|nr:YALI0C06556p [Yarrowia lipolytica CLIB122]AOW02434.1 hypothetical protein YALI1_C08791g [Yarrowia lipolytica]KAB8281202.1 hypothetical protein BKA91DRAFT_35856 [Yarrowia lipolytica]KAE8170374.1 hypothetical protein BKA90DRAFT_38499 [Yarrowia lipolytica]KAJ8053139.1 hypothetical protein LXG23DRAFT_22475 [Yarrowia lipolytica]RDW23898.1 hypothetical protein B0I71DRAFT_8080 [Yarrowia lipolytica]|eukprot:XP_501522.2 YALI0C06556p [Yarrowia lipolytica CLIB122]